jgi:hypothetical protein
VEDSQGPAPQSCDEHYGFTNGMSMYFTLQARRARTRLRRTDLGFSCVTGGLEWLDHLVILSFAGNRQALLPLARIEAIDDCRCFVLVDLRGCCCEYVHGWSCPLFPHVQFHVRPTLMQPRQRTVVGLAALLHWPAPSYQNSQKMTKPGFLGDGQRDLKTAPSDKAVEE